MNFEFSAPRHEQNRGSETNAPSEDAEVSNTLTVGTLRSKQSYVTGERKPTGFRQSTELRAVCSTCSAVSPTSRAGVCVRLAVPMTMTSASISRA